MYFREYFGSSDFFVTSWSVLRNHLTPKELLRKPLPITLPAVQPPPKMNKQCEASRKITYIDSFLKFRLLYHSIQFGLAARNLRLANLDATKLVIICPIRAYCEIFPRDFFDTDTDVPENSAYYFRGAGVFLSLNEIFLVITAPNSTDSENASKGNAVSVISGPYISALFISKLKKAF